MTVASNIALENVLVTIPITIRDVLAAINGNTLGIVF